MGLASSLSTALTGLTASETTIDVVGNNLANSNTVGFKSSTANFATQFSQTMSLGSAPSSDTGGTNPRQTGLGTTVAEITPDFTQGTVEVSSNPMDLAIQGEGFFIVQGSGNEQLFTRNGVFKLNSQNEMVSITGQRLLGYTADSNYVIQTTQLDPITIPLGQAAVAQATQNVYMEGTLSPTGDLATEGTVTQTDPLGDASYISPITSSVPAPTTSTEVPASMGTVTPSDVGGAIVKGLYSYRITYHNSHTNSETSFYETTINMSGSTTDTNSVAFTNLPVSASGNYDQIRIYRTNAGGTGSYHLVGQAANVAGASVTDTFSDAQIANNGVQDTGLLDGQYSYYITYVDESGIESAPQATPISATAVNSGIKISDLPLPSGNPPGHTYVAWRIYRNYPSAGGQNTYARVAQVGSTADPFAGATPATPVSFIDNVTDQALSTDQVTHPTIDFVGKKISSSSLLTNIQRYSNGVYERVFQAGDLAFTGTKGGSTLTTKNLTVTGTTTAGQLATFFQQALGIQTIAGESAGCLVDNGRFVCTGNVGTGNALNIGLSSMQLTPTGAAAAQNVNMPFTTTQQANGNSAMTDFIVYDSLGIPLQVRTTAVLVARDSVSTTYRWYGDSGSNDPSSGVGISVGTGLITFDGEGKFVSATNSTVDIDRSHVSSKSPLEFQLDFSQLSGLAAEKSTLAASRQDGSAPGTLTSFIVGEDGLITGVFSNGVTRPLAQIELARFANANGLVSAGQNMYKSGVNSGLPVIGNPKQQGIGSVLGGAIERSNTDIGGNLIDLILASTMYRSNARVITTVQQMFDELLQLGR
jgi:flagellar hook protein FlgE